MKIKYESQKRLDQLRDLRKLIDKELEKEKGYVLSIVVTKEEFSLLNSFGLIDRKNFYQPTIYSKVKVEWEQ